MSKQDEFDNWRPPMNQCYSADQWQEIRDDGGIPSNPMHLLDISCFTCRTPLEGDDDVYTDENWKENDTATYCEKCAKERVAALKAEAITFAEEHCSTVRRPILDLDKQPDWRSQIFHAAILAREESEESEDD